MSVNAYKTCKANATCQFDIATKKCVTGTIAPKTQYVQCSEFLKHPGVAAYEKSQDDIQKAQDASRKATDVMGKAREEVVKANAILKNAQSEVTKAQATWTKAKKEAAVLPDIKQFIIKIPAASPSPKPKTTPKPKTK